MPAGTPPPRRALDEASAEPRAPDRPARRTAADLAEGTMATTYEGVRATRMRAAGVETVRAGLAGVARGIDGAGMGIARVGLVAILLWIGGFKFTHAEAEGIRPLIEHSPFLGWLYGVADVDTVARLIGSREIVIALLIAARAFAPKVSALGSLLAVGTFLTTLSFLVTTPGTFAIVEGYPAPTAVGGFLVKDLFLLAAAVLTLAESLKAVAGEPCACAVQPRA